MFDPGHVSLRQPPVRLTSTIQVIPDRTAGIVINVYPGYGATVLHPIYQAAFFVEYNSCF
jgi:hypothetical protein